MPLRACLFLTLGFLARAALAEPPADTRFLAQLCGQWQMSGSVLGISEFLTVEKLLSKR